MKRRGRIPAGKPTRLEEFIRTHDLLPAVLAEEAGISRQHLLRVRFGKAEPTRLMMIWITIAAKRLLGRKRLRVSELFDFEDGAW